MADIFDTIDAKNGGDIFDRVAPSKKETTIQDTPEWAGRTPNLYGLYGAIKETGKTLIPYSKYLDPVEREAFTKKTTQEQTNDLLWQNAELLAQVGGGQIIKGIGAVAGPLFERVAPKATQKVSSILQKNIGTSKTVAPKIQAQPEPIVKKPVGGIAPEIEQAAIKEPIISPEGLEVMVKGGATGNLPKYSTGSSINLEKLDTTQDVLQLHNALTEAAEKEIGKKTVTWAETKEAADDLAWDTKDFLKAAKKKGGFSAAEIEAARGINVSAINDLFKTIKEMPVDPLKRTQEMRLAVMDKVNNYVEIAKSLSTKSSEAGRALNVHKKMISENPDFAQDKLKQSVFKKLLDDNGGTELTDAMINDLQGVDFNDLKAVRGILQKYHKSSVGDKVYEAWLNGLLSAPASHAANILGNSLALLTKIPEKAVSSFLGGRHIRGEVNAEVFGMYQGLKDGLKAGREAFKTGLPSDMAMKVELQRYHAIPGKLGDAIRIPTRALTAADELFKSIVYRSELNRRAFIVAKKEGLDGDALTQRMANILNDPVNPEFTTIHNAARQESVYRTFNKPLGQYGQKIMRLRDEVPGLKYILPFVRTPINIAKFALERTPFNLAKVVLDFKKGKITQAELSDELAKPILGSIMCASAAIASLEGYITGAAPKNQTDRDLKYSYGWQPYSLYVNGKYYPYNRLEPIGSLLGMTADLVNATKDSEATINEKAGRIMMSVSKNLVSKTYVSSVTGILDALSDPERFGGNYIEKLLGSVVPSGVAAMARSVDPVIRETESPLDAVQARIPFASKALPPKLGAFEEPAQRSGSTLSRMISPITVSDEDQQKKTRAEHKLAALSIDRKKRKDREKRLRDKRQMQIQRKDQKTGMFP